MSVILAPLPISVRSFECQSVSFLGVVSVAVKVGVDNISAAIVVIVVVAVVAVVAVVFEVVVVIIAVVVVIIAVVVVIIAVVGVAVVGVSVDKSFWQVDVISFSSLGCHIMAKDWMKG